MTFTKKDLAESVSRSLGLPANKSDDLIDSLFQTMKKTLAAGDDLLISGFGKFAVKDKRERRGRNPHTGTNLTLSARRVVVFQCSPKLKAKLNGQK